MDQGEFVMEFEDTRLSITHKLARKVKSGLVSLCKSEAVVTESRINYVFQRLGINRDHYVKQFIEDGLNLGNGRELKVVESWDDIEDGGKKYRLRVIDTILQRERDGYGPH